MNQSNKKNVLRINFKSKQLFYKISNTLHIMRANNLFFLFNSKHDFNVWLHLKIVNYILELPDLDCVLIS